MPGKTKSRKRHGTRSPCSYCGRVHKKGKRANSCGGHKVRSDGSAK